MTTKNDPRIFRFFWKFLCQQWSKSSWNSGRYRFFWNSHHKFLVEKKIETIKPGFCNDIFNQLQLKLAQLQPEERICCLKWDELTVKNFEEYSVKYDCIEGLVDLGPLGHRNERARYVFVFCLDSLNEKNPWRQLIAYFLTGTGMKVEEMHKLLEQCLVRLDKAGANVVLTTCDQGPSNQSLYSTILGVAETATPSFLTLHRSTFPI